MNKTLYTLAILFCFSVSLTAQNKKIEPIKVNDELVAQLELSKDVNCTSELNTAKSIAPGGCLIKLEFNDKGIINYAELLKDNVDMDKKALLKAIYKSDALEGNYIEKKNCRVYEVKLSEK